MENTSVGNSCKLSVLSQVSKAHGLKIIKWDDEIDQSTVHSVTLSHIHGLCGEEGGGKEQVREEWWMPFFWMPESHHCGWKEQWNIGPELRAEGQISCILDGILGYKQENPL